VYFQELHELNNRLLLADKRKDSSNGTASNINDDLENTPIKLADTEVDPIQERLDSLQKQLDIEMKVSGYSGICAPATFQ